MVGFSKEPFPRNNIQSQSVFVSVCEHRGNRVHGHTLWKESNIILKGCPIRGDSGHTPRFSPLVWIISELSATSNNVGG